LVAYNSWYDPSARLKAAGKNFAMTIPKEGAVGMFDSFMISKNAHHKDLAHQYVNHQIDPAIQQQMVKITGLAPSNIETLGLLKAEEIRALHLDDPDYFNRMILWDHMPRKNLYDEVLNAVRQDSRQKQR
jgi:spermidine/putrescine-binding protein